MSEINKRICRYIYIVYIIKKFIKPGVLSMPIIGKRKGNNVSIVKFRKNETVNKNEFVFVGKIVFDGFKTVKDGMTIFYG